MGSGSSVDVCLSDNLPCSRLVKGVSLGCFGACVKRSRNGDTVRICCRWYGISVSLLEYSMREKIRGEHTCSMDDVELAV